MLCCVAGMLRCVVMHMLPCRWLLDRNPQPSSKQDTGLVYMRLQLMEGLAGALLQANRVHGRLSCKRL